jgi:hypothetical protein
LLHGRKRPAARAVPETFLVGTAKTANLRVTERFVSGVPPALGHEARAAPAWLLLANAR